LHRLRSERRQYDDLIARAPDCISVTGTILKDEQNSQDGTAMANDRNGSLEAQPNQAKSCDEIQNTIKNHANELRITEDSMMFKRATVEAYYLQYVDGITQKMPQIIPALRLLDSGRPWVNAWARSPFELMEMFLLVSMGMLGGIINVTRWLVDRSAPNPS